MPRGYKSEDYSHPRTSESYIYPTQVKALRETDRALLCADSNGNEFWVPKSQLHDDSEVFEVGGEGKLVVTRWLADQKGWAD
jgi:hypothetical protein